MASARSAGLPPNFVLTPQQQNLLFRALTSNQPANGSPSTNALSLSPSSMTESPMQNGMSDGNGSGSQDSPLLDFDYDFGPDSSFDFDFANVNGQLIGDLPGKGDSSKASTPENDNTEKRSHPEGEDDDKDEGSSKRRESEGKVPKKPGRKPLMNEPSSKRKAQNRAAQRAFRERKEQHLKDLETKVEELEKASKSANNENSQLRAQVEKLTMELTEYKKRMSLAATARSASGGSARPPFFGQGLVNNINDVNFQFEFPKFGTLPGQASAVNATTGSNGVKRNPSFPSPGSNFSLNAQSSPSDKTNEQASPAPTKSRENSDAQREALSKFAGSFGSPYDTLANSGSRTSLDSLSYSLGGGSSASPSASSNSNAGPSSSCGTSPEPLTQSPLGFKPVDTLTTIGEESSGLNTETTTNQFNNFGNVDFNFDWLASQNGGQFDPQLFGDYREPQDNVLATNTFDDSFFNDAFDADFTTPFNVAPSPNPAKKPNLLAEIDARKEKEDTIVADVNGKLLTCTNIWEKLQNCPKVQSGDIDLDGLCSDLQKKAKCGGTGAVVDEKDFRAVMTKHLGDSACPDSN